MDDRQLIADLLSALEYHTEQTRPIQFSRVAIEAAREYLRKPAQRTWVGLEKSDIPDESRAMMQLFTDPENQPTQHGTVTLEYMQREIVKEREACAKVVDAAKAGPEDWDSNDWNQAVEFCASRIRARSNT